jgi:hypothetical protein
MSTDKAGIKVITKGCPDPAAMGGNFEPAVLEGEKAKIEPVWEGQV